MIKQKFSHIKNQIRKTIEFPFNVFLIIFIGMMCLGSSAFYPQIEKFYYSARIFQRLGKWFIFVTAVFLCMNVIRYIFKNQFEKLLLFQEKLFKWAIWLGFSGFTIGLGLRWFLAGHAPWSNQYECMVFGAWATLLAGISLSRHSRLPITCGSLLAGIVLLIAHIPSIDPSFSPLPPVLKSKLMITHISIAMASYGFFSVGTVLALSNLSVLALPISRKDNLLLLKFSKWSKIAEQALWIGLLLVTMGSILGAIWANDTWGRYWGWDPKESWSLIMILSYAMLLQLRFVLRSRLTYWFNVLVLPAFGTVLMTYFGVNRFFSGMHAYGGESNPQFPFIVFWILGIWIALSFLAYRNRKRI